MHQRQRVAGAEPAAPRFWKVITVGGEAQHANKCSATTNMQVPRHLARARLATPRGRPLNMAVIARRTFNKLKRQGPTFKESDKRALNNHKRSGHRFGL